jgi:hypothetical protein
MPTRAERGHKAPGGSKQRLAPALLGGCWLLLVCDLAHVSAQAPEAAPDSAALLERLNALEAEVARQREQLEAQQRVLDSQPQSQPADGAPADEAALADLIAEAKDDAAEATAPEEPLLRLYGFADVGLQRLWADDVVTEISPETDKLTFVLGNVNVYLDANPSSEFRFLAEIRFGLFPSGSVSRAKGSWAFGPPMDTSVTDPSAANAFFTSIRWAGVMIERAHIDWTPSDLFNLRAGLFLTPYGIWNVDHGTPTRIMVSEPLFLSSQLVPSQLIGLEAFGSVPFLPWTLGYHLHVSNGRTNGQVDFSDSKAIGGRLFLSTRNPFPFKLGISGYYGNSEDVETTVSVSKTNYELDEYAVSGDLSLDVGALRVRSELVVSWQVYEKGKRRVWAGSQIADTMRMGAYLVFAYQLPWYGLEPLAMVEFIRVPVPRLVPMGEGLIMPAVGLNVYFTPTTMLRTQMSIAHGFDFSSDPVDTEGFLYQAVARLITAF